MEHGYGSSTPEHGPRVAGPVLGHRSHGSFGLTGLFPKPDGNGWLMQASTTRLPETERDCGQVMSLMERSRGVRTAGVTEAPPRRS